MARIVGSNGLMDDSRSMAVRLWIEISVGLALMSVDLSSELMDGRWQCAMDDADVEAWSSTNAICCSLLRRIMLSFVLAVILSL
jgi:hypothetical protein